MGRDWRDDILLRFSGMYVLLFGVDENGVVREEWEKRGL